MIGAVVFCNLLFLLIYIIHSEESCNDCIGSDQFCAARKGIYGSFVFNTSEVLLDDNMIYMYNNSILNRSKLKTTS